LKTNAIVNELVIDNTLELSVLPMVESSPQPPSGQKKSISSYNTLKRDTKNIANNSSNRDSINGTSFSNTGNGNSGGNNNGTGEITTTMVIPSGSRISDWCYTGSLDSAPPVVKTKDIYENVRLLGRGAFGEVNLVKNIEDNKMYVNYNNNRFYL
jgi:hypothetical protein